ncbi:uncharacterized protein YbjT (DUF2867 family) [Stackebrandtia albiflava]|uniref:Uncharacterized protein YbjT (DUF2867 family) n=1 Tax=Stackebrandtia albiflava TaxID=406432 RepID=A0A562UYE7_9ACTN|nr:NmrA family transcriptional regulator [Stackebrandtia albiflava]TWJ10635.1 uncharacterized protein YbjT (DUF2867 family) [Stackebrandtia albiflava]
MNTLHLVIGGTGKTGRRVAERLAAHGDRVRPVSRSTEVPFDWNVPATWPGAVEDATTAYLSYHPDLAFPGAAAQIAEFAELAAGAGVRRLVLLSGRGEPAAAEAERGLHRSGAEWTVLRAAWFAQNFSEHFLVDPVREGVIALPAGDVTEPFVDVDDLADVAVAAMTAPGHHGRTYELTGPRLLGFADVADILTRVLARPVRYLPVSPQEYLRAAVDAGVPAEQAEPLTALFTTVLDGRNSHTTDTVAELLGRPARDFDDYARRTAATGVWG